MTNWVYKVTFGNPRTASIIFGFVTAAQFFIEILFFICFAVYIAAPVSTVIKVFYGIAAAFAPIFLVFSLLFVHGVSKDEYAWMRPWLFSQAGVTLTETVLSLIAFAILSDLHDIANFYRSAWNLLQFQTGNLLFIGDASTCDPITGTMLPQAGHGVTFVAYFAQQGANGWIAFLIVLMIFKFLLNIVMFYTGYVHYRALQQGEGRRKTYGR